MDKNKFGNDEEKAGAKVPWPKELNVVYKADCNLAPAGNIQIMYVVWGLLAHQLLLPTDTDTDTDPPTQH